MASMSMAASSFVPAIIKLPSSPATIRPRSILTVKASTDIESKAVNKQDQDRISKKTVRRDMVFAGVAMAACSLAKMAMADEEPKRGSDEAKKKYATVCVTMPTARICRN